MKRRHFLLAFRIALLLPALALIPPFDPFAGKGYKGLC
jgi:hypothetical protein